MTCASARALRVLGVVEQRAGGARCAAAQLVGAEAGEVARAELLCRAARAARVDSKCQARQARQRAPRDPSQPRAASRRRSALRRARCRSSSAGDVRRRRFR